jgi:hypothetical protein
MQSNTTNQIKTILSIERHDFYSYFPEVLVVDANKFLPQSFFPPPPTHPEAFTS